MGMLRNTAKVVRISPDSLAHHLEMSAARYKETAAQCRASHDKDGGAHWNRLAATFDRQEAEAREWAAALREARLASYDDAHDSKIRIELHPSED